MFPSPAASPAPWLARKMEHSSGITSLRFSSSDPSELDSQILVAASLDLQLTLTINFGRQ